jgi:hypothetical protein
MNNVKIADKAVPTAQISMNKSRLKIYETTESEGSVNVVYLNDKQEFEIELFNPTQNTIAASVSFNGGIESHQKLIINPGQRVFLERYLDTNKKFKFDTYEVDDNNSAVDNAIAKNGLVEIKFYNEIAQTYPGGFTTNLPTWTYFGGSFRTPPNDNIGNSGSFGLTYGSTSGNCCTTFKALNNTTLTSTCSVGNSETTKSRIEPVSRQKVKETGKIEKGSNSNQKFDSSNKSFHHTPFETTRIRIMPASRRNFIKEDVKAYCTSCGIRQRKDNWKFCPKCGNKFE